MVFAVTQSFHLLVLVRIPRTLPNPRLSKKNPKYPRNPRSTIDLLSRCLDSQTRPVAAAIGGFPPRDPEVRTLSQLLAATHRLQRVSVDSRRHRFSSPQPPPFPNLRRLSYCRR